MIDLPTLDHENFWVFGYGSLMWQPGFSYDEDIPALLVGYKRSFCMYSYHHRGNRGTPGLVLGLTQGTQCPGIAFKVVPANVEQTITYLQKREMAHYAYVPSFLDVKLEDGRTVAAYTHIVNTQDPQYAHDLSLDEKAQIINNAEGLSGPNREYLFNTVKHLDSMGYMEDEFSGLFNRINLLMADGESGSGI